ncbi:MAG TPA: glycoside hydrolase family 43, partial [Marinobacter sp.]|nr:glycoside hydrolase family 43 [Marinobacter sp.]
MQTFLSAGWARALIALVVVGLAGWAWWSMQPEGSIKGIASGNGRVEAVEIDIATKTGGRVRDILAGEGDFVGAGDELARMDTAVLEAQRREAQARLQQARMGIETAQSQVTQRQAEKQAAEALIAQRRAELDAAQRRLARSEELAGKDAVPISKLDDDRAAFQAARAAVAAAQAQAAAAQGAIG